MRGDDESQGCNRLDIASAWCRHAAWEGVHLTNAHRHKNWIKRVEELAGGRVIELDWYGGRPAIGYTIPRKKAEDVWKLLGRVLTRMKPDTEEYYMTVDTRRMLLSAINSKEGLTVIWGQAS